MKQFKIRASQLGALMTNDRSGKAMGETAKTYLKEWVVQQLTGKTKEIKSKYLSRGNAMEDLAIQRVAKHYSMKLNKNSEQLEDDFFTGTYDAKGNDKVIDTKVPFEAFTFPYFVDKIDKNYYAQLQVYMHLTGLKKASLCYCLENGSEEQIEKLSWQIAKDKDKDEPDIDDWNEADLKLNYDHLPEHLRIKTFEFDYDAEFIELAKERVLEARNYIENELLKKLEICTTKNT